MVRVLPDTNHSSNGLHPSPSGRISGRMGKEFCEDCPHRENCFVREKQQFYSYGFYERKLALAHRRKRLDNPAEKEFLNLRAGAESLVNEVYYQDGEKARFTGTIKVKNASIAKAIGTSGFKRASRFLESEAKHYSQRDSRRRRDYSARKLDSSSW